MNTERPNKSLEHFYRLRKERQKQQSNSTKEKVTAAVSGLKRTLHVSAATDSSAAQDEKQIDTKWQKQASKQLEDGTFVCLHLNANQIRLCVLNSDNCFSEEMNQTVLNTKQFMMHCTFQERLLVLKNAILRTIPYEMKCIKAENEALLEIRAAKLVIARISIPANKHMHELTSSLAQIYYLTTTNKQLNKKVTCDN